MLSLTVDAVRSNHGVMIGPSTAADLLARSDAYEDWPRGVHGKDMATNLPRAIEVQRREVTAAVEPAFHEIAGALSELCQKASKPRRVVLAGGAADSEELLLMLTSSLGCPVELRPSPGDLSVMGWPSCAPQASLTALERAVLALRGRAGALPHLRPSPWQRFCLSPIDLSRNLRVVHLRAATGLAC
jgi:actin-like ATPase involved in cell morphogenesis